VQLKVCSAPLPDYLSRRMVPTPEAITPPIACRRRPALAQSREMSVETRRRLSIALERASGRFDLMERRLRELEAVAATVEDLAERIERIEERLGPRSFSREALERQRREAIVGARARGLSVSAISRALGVSQGTVKTVIRDLPPPRGGVVGVNGKKYSGRRNGTPRKSDPDERPKGAGARVLVDTTWRVADGGARPQA
jgi:Homeodomain-like domain